MCRHSTLDKVIVAESAIIYILSIGLVIYYAFNLEPGRGIFPALKTPFISYGLSTLIIVDNLTIWIWIIYYKGLHSALWFWLPPFSSFKNRPALSKLFFLIALSLTTFLGLILLHRDQSTFSVGWSNAGVRGRSSGPALSLEFKDDVPPAGTEPPARTP